jgi:tripartite ATP-independent transporter DctP family solute receptor
MKYLPLFFENTMIRLSLKLMLTSAVCIAFGLVNAQEIQERTIKFGHLNNVGHPTSLGTQRFAELVATKSGGKLKVQEFPASALGSDMQQQSALQGGIQEMVAPSTTSLVGIVKEFGLIDFPFSVSNFAQADGLLDGPFGKALLAKLPEKGLVGLGYWDLGFRNVTNSKRPITRPEDMEGLKLRVIPNPVFIQTFQALKANPVPMAFGELYGALESKAVDGQENPYAVILSNKFNEVQKYVSATNHVYAALIVLVSKKFWDKLSVTEQKILTDSAHEAQIYQRQVSRSAAQSAVAELERKGMLYNELSKAEQMRMSQVAKPVSDRLAAGYDPAIVKLYNDELARLRGGV